jgi:hypothetical protein
MSLGAGRRRRSACGSRVLEYPFAAPQNIAVTFRNAAATTQDLVGSGQFWVLLIVLGVPKRIRSTYHSIGNRRSPLFRVPANWKFAVSLADSVSVRITGRETRVEVNALSDSRRDAAVFLLLNAAKDLLNPRLTNTYGPHNCALCLAGRSNPPLFAWPSTKEKNPVLAGLRYDRAALPDRHERLHIALVSWPAHSVAFLS